MQIKILSLHMLCFLAMLIATLGIGGEVTTSVLLSAVLVYRRRELQSLHLDWRDWIIGTFALFYGISMGLSQNWIVSSYSAVSVLECLLLFYALRTFEVEETYNLILIVVSIISTLSLTGFFQRLLHVPVDRLPDDVWSQLSLYRNFVVGLTGISTSEYPTGFFIAAPLLCVVIILAKKRPSMIALLVLFLSSIVVSTTFSRAAYLSYSFGVICVIVCIAIMPLRKSQRSLVAAALLAGSMLIVVQPSLRRSVFTTASLRANMSQQRSDEGRLKSYKNDIASVNHFPLFGTGPGTYRFLSRGQRPQALNSYIQSVLELGLLTTLLAFMVLCGEWIYALRARSDWLSLFIRSIPIFSLLIYNMFWSSLLMERLSLIGMMFALLLLRMTPIQRHIQSRPNEK